MNRNISSDFKSPKYLGHTWPQQRVRDKDFPFRAIDLEGVGLPDDCGHSLLLKNVQETCKPCWKTSCERADILWSKMGTDHLPNSTHSSIALLQIWGPTLGGQYIIHRHKTDSRQRWIMLNPGCAMETTFWGHTLWEVGSRFLFWTSKQNTLSRSDER